MKDPRYTIAHREALIGLGLASFHFILWFGFAYGLGSRPVEKYSFIFGLPAWFFYSCIIGFVVVTTLLIVCVTYLFKDVSLEVAKDAKDGES